MRRKPTATLREVIARYHMGCYVHDVRQVCKRIGVNVSTEPTGHNKCRFVIMTTDIGAILDHYDIERSQLTDNQL